MNESEPKRKKHQCLTFLQRRQLQDWILANWNRIEQMNMWVKISELAQHELGFAISSKSIPANMEAIGKGDWKPRRGGSRKNGSGISGHTRTLRIIAAELGLLQRQLGVTPSPKFREYLEWVAAVEAGQQPANSMPPDALPSKSRRS